MTETVQRQHSICCSFLSVHTACMVVSSEAAARKLAPFMIIPKRMCHKQQRHRVCRRSLRGGRTRRRRCSSRTGRTWRRPRWAPHALRWRTPSPPRPSSTLPGTCCPRWAWPRPARWWPTARRGLESRVRVGVVHTAWHLLSSVGMATTGAMVAACAASVAGLC